MLHTYVEAFHVSHLSMVENTIFKHFRALPQTWKLFSHFFVHVFTDDLFTFQVHIFLYNIVIYSL